MIAANPKLTKHLQTNIVPKMIWRKEYDLRGIDYFDYPKGRKEKLHQITDGT